MICLIGASRCFAACILRCINFLEDFFSRDQNTLLHATFVKDFFFKPKFPLFSSSTKLQCTAALIQIVFFQNAVNTVETLYTRETVKSEETEAIVKTSETVKIVETAETVEIVETAETPKTTQIEETVELVETETAETQETTQTEETVEIVETEKNVEILWRLQRL